MDIKKALSSLLLVTAVACPVALAQSDGPTVDVALDVRADFEYIKTKDVDPASSGIHGRYFNLKVNGTINSQLSYSWRQRLNKYKEAENDVFSATDWIYLTYKPTANFALSAGKQVVLVGGYEYDAPPIDVMYASRFWNNFACYQFGASATYITDDAKHQLSAQVTNSPYSTIGASCYAYNLFWMGAMGPLSTLWSVNLMEYERGKYVNIISLGNRLDFGVFDLELDLMNRATSRHKYWFADYTAIAKSEYHATPWMTFMAKGGYGDWRPTPWEGVHYEKPFYGGGLIFYPMHGSHDLRLHAFACNYHDNEGAQTTEINVGITWKMGIFSSRR